jgi:hypothetical protein
MLIEWSPPQYITFKHIVISKRAKQYKQLKKSRFVQQQQQQLSTQTYVNKASNAVKVKVEIEK